MLVILPVRELTMVEDGSLRSLSQDLANNVPFTVTAALKDIEEKSRALHVEGPTAGQFSVGPFYVCRLGSEPSITPERGITASDTASPGGMELATPIEKHERHPERGHGPSEFDLGRETSFDQVSSSLLDFLQWGDLFGYDIGMPDFPPLFPSSGLPPNQPDTLPVEEDLSFNIGLGQEHMLNQTLYTCEGGPELPQLDLAVDAPVLLRHFSDQVMNQMGSLPSLSLIHI